MEGEPGVEMSTTWGLGFRVDGGGRTGGVDVYYLG